MNDQDHIVVFRGGKRHPDPTYCCLAHNATPGNYGVLHFRGGRVVRREIIPATERDRVERYTNKDSAFRGAVYVDRRSDNTLLPLRASSEYRTADLSLFRRAKSDEEINAIESLHERTRRQLDAPEGSISEFRGSGTERHVMQKTEHRGFTQYRAGLKDDRGRLSDLTRIVPKTADWEARMRRVYKGLDAVEKLIVPGASLAQLNAAFAKELDQTQDSVYGNVVCQTGFEGDERSVSCDTLQSFNVVKVGAAVGAKNGETAVVYKGVKTVLDDEAAEENFRGTCIGATPVEVLTQLKRFPNLMTTTGEKSGVPLRDLYRGVTKYAGSFDTLETAVSRVISDVQKPVIEDRKEEPTLPRSESPSPPAPEATYTGSADEQRMALRAQLRGC